MIILGFILLPFVLFFLFKQFRNDQKIEDARLAKKQEEELQNIFIQSENEERSLEFISKLREVNYRNELERKERQRQWYAGNNRSHLDS